MRKLSLFILALILISSCTTYSDVQLDEFDQEISTHLSKEGIEMERSASGLYYMIESEGEGDPILLTNYVTLKYTTRLLDGTIVDENLGTTEDEPFRYRVSDLITSWQEMLVMVKSGAKVHLIAPPQLGYGQQDLNDIPPGSILDCEFEVVSVE